MSGTSEVRRGTPVVAGVAAGPVVRPTAGVVIETFVDQPSTRGTDEEGTRLLAAVETVAGRLERRADAATGDAHAVLVAQVSLVRDKGLRRAAEKVIAGGGSAESGVAAAVAQFASVFEQMGGLMAERVTDLHDVGTRVVAELQGLPEPGVANPDAPSVLMADDLAPADTAVLDLTRVVALVTRLGGPTSHTAIIARQLALPCIVAADIADVAADRYVLVDGSTGEVVLDPDPVEVSRLVAEDAARQARIEAWTGPAATADGRPVTLLANVADGVSARDAAGHPCEGVGLFRSELAFLEREEEPSVDDQTDLYAEVFQAFGDRKVVLRTLDAGSDKPMTFANLDDEENPALGVRGLRLSVGNPGLMARQLDAVAAAAERTGTRPWVMAPMVATTAEARMFAEQVRARGLTPGVMVEIPAAALLAHRILEHVDFLSIGTNDLSQYTMAADRLSADLAELTDAWQPAVLQLIAITAEAGRSSGKPVGVCGEAAADAMLACVLIGLGCTSLSMAATALRPVGAALADVTYEQCRHAADAAMAADGPRGAREAASAVLAG